MITLAYIAALIISTPIIIALLLFAFAWTWVKLFDIRTDNSDKYLNTKNGK